MYVSFLVHTAVIVLLLPRLRILRQLYVILRSSLSFIFKFIQFLQASCISFSTYVPINNKRTGGNTEVDGDLTVQESICFLFGVGQYFCYYHYYNNTITQRISATTNRKANPHQNLLFKFNFKLHSNSTWLDFSYLTTVLCFHSLLLQNLELVSLFDMRGLVLIHRDVLSIAKSSWEYSEYFVFISGW